MTQSIISSAGPFASKGIRLYKSNFRVRSFYIINDKHMNIYRLSGAPEGTPEINNMCKCKKYIREKEEDV